jgi:tyrosine-protein kinase Etk/Wzc
MTPGIDSSAQAPAPGERGDANASSFDLIDVLLLIAKHRLLVFGLPVVVAVAAVVLSLLMPNIYTANARIVPPQQGSAGVAAALGSLGALASVAGGPLAGRTPNDFYVALLQSRRVADSMIARFDLRQAYHASTAMDTRAALAGATRIVSGRDGLITVEVDDKDPKHAAALANGYIDELYKLTQTLAVTEASQRRLFFEKQLENAKNQLADAEISLKKTQEATGLIKLDDQGRAIIDAVARLQAQVATKEVQITAMQAFATEQNSDLIMAQRELAGLRTQLANVERSNHQLGRGNVLVPTGRIPEAGLEYVRKVRTVKYYETIFELLAKQFELAKIDEAKDTSLIQVLDRAVEPERKSGPKRSVIVIFSTLMAAMGGLVLALVIEAAQLIRRNVGYAERFRLLRARLRWGTAAR